MPKRGLRCRPMCPSVTLVDSIQTAEDIVKPLDAVAPSLQFLFRPPEPNSKGNPFSRGAKFTGVGIFFAIFAIYLGNGTIDPQLLWNINRKS